MPGVIPHDHGSDARLAQVGWGHRRCGSAGLPGPPLPSGRCPGRRTGLAGGRALPRQAPVGLQRPRLHLEGLLAGARRKEAEPSRVLCCAAQTSGRASSLVSACRNCASSQAASLPPGRARHRDLLCSRESEQLRGAEAPGRPAAGPEAGCRRPALGRRSRPSRSALGCANSPAHGRWRPSRRRPPSCCASSSKVAPCRDREAGHQLAAALWRLHLRCGSALRSTARDDT